MSNGTKRLHSFKIKTGPTIRGAVVEMDGQRLRRLRRVTVNAEVNEVTTVVVEFHSDDVEIEADALAMVNGKEPEPSE